MYVANERIAGGQGWLVTSDPSAAGGARLLNPDQGLAKSSSPAASGSDYFEVQFTAGGFGWVVVYLDFVSREELAELTFEAWRLSAPTDLLRRRADRLPI